MSETRTTLTRRSLLRNAALPSAAALLLPQMQLRAQSPELHSGSTAMHLPVLAQPDLVYAYAGDAEAERSPLQKSGSDWTGSHRAAGMRLSFAAGEAKSSIQLEASGLPVQRIHLRWKARIAGDTLALGDAWERGYGDLEWRPLQAERVLPWYALLHREQRTFGMGVKTGAAAFAFWQVDVSGVSLWLDLRNGGNGVLLGQRVLDVASIVTCAGAPGESSFAMARRLCAAMAEGTAIPARRGRTSLGVLYGSNDWYYAYGKNTHDGILRDADLIKSLAPAGANRPFNVIDDGYQDRSRFPSMPKLAAEIRSRGVLPGIWVRPLRAAAGTQTTLLLPDARCNGSKGDQALPAYDPTIPEAMHAVLSVIDEACHWGYDLIKHDFTIYELLGQWGSQMGASPTRGNWHFSDRSLTNAEVVTALYRQFRSVCGEDRVILGCNTIGHLSVGLFDATRAGDDVSGTQWERTRRMGVNTLAFRLPQHRAFHAVDADCVAITPEVPWSMSRQWLRLVAESGTVLLISADPEAIGPEQRQALREAFQH